MFQHTASTLTNAAEHVLQLAKQYGATATEADLSESVGQNVQVRMRQTEHIEYQQDQSLDITVYFGYRKGRASTADLSDNALAEAVQAACNIARYTAEDPFAGLADKKLLATEFGDLDKYHEWDLSGEQAIALAMQCETAALDADSRISNSGGADVSVSHYQYVYANSHGFCCHQRGTRHSISCSVVAGIGGGMERDYWYDVSCDACDLDSPENIGATAAARTIRRLNPKGLETGSYPVVFDTNVSGSLIGHLTGALGGSQLYRRTSFLVDSLGRQILPPSVSLREEPHIPRALGSTYFDSEGVATRPRFVIENGVVRGYFLGSYSARKLGMESTGNAGGAHNLYLSSSVSTQAGLLRQMGTGLLVTELMGQGVNLLTGDYSRGAAGFWVEGGEIAYPVSGITIAGRLQDMFLNIEGTANDARRNASSKIGSILIGRMTVAGA